METVVDLRLRQNKMNRQPTVSVIIIFLNAERFIEEAIQSVFAQTYSDWELLLVDDGSNDESTKTAQRYAEQNPERVCYFEHGGHQNRGTSASRNLGIQHAQGKYIAFLDADDVWLPQKLEQQVAILAAHPQVGMVYGLSQWWYSWSGESEHQKQDFIHQLGVVPNTIIEPPKLLPLFFFQQSAAIPGASSILVRRGVIEQVGGFENTFRGEYDEQVFYAKVGLQNSVFASEECWDRYRQHPNSIYSIAQQTGEQYPSRLFFLNWLADYLKEQGVNDAEILRGLQREQWRYRHPNLFWLWRNIRPFILKLAQRILPHPMRHWLSAKWKAIDSIPPVGWVRFGSLRRLFPFSREFGFDRGVPIDRHYIERFLAEHSTDIHGHVLEIEDDIYARRFGGERVIKIDVLHVRQDAPKATIIADLTRAGDLPCDTFDCIILTQTLHFIYDVQAAIRTIHGMLKPGGVVLATIPGISPISRYDMERWGQYWSFTTLSAQRLFEEIFPPANVIVEGHGNVLAAASFLYGMSAQELRQAELDQHDPDYEVVIMVRAVKPLM